MYKPTVKGNNLQIRKVVDVLAHAHKPLICVGGGTILGNGEQVVREFANKFHIPVVSTMMGIGVMPNDDWLDQFDMFSIYEVLPQILELWGDNLATEVAAKKGLAEVNGK